MDFLQRQPDFLAETNSAERSLRAAAFYVRSEFGPKNNSEVMHSREWEEHQPELLFAIRRFVPQPRQSLVVGVHTGDSSLRDVGHSSAQDTRETRKCGLGLVGLGLVQLREG